MEDFRINHSNPSASQKVRIPSYDQFGRSFVRTDLLLYNSYYKATLFMFGPNALFFASGIAPLLVSLQYLKNLKENRELIFITFL